MHVADALVSPEVAGTMLVLSGVTAGYSVYKLKQEEDFTKKIPTMGIMGAFVFATQMVNFTIPGTGSSGHLCGGLLLSSILGPYAGFLSMIGVLLIQCLFFADGGLMAIGVNVWNMAFYGCFLGSLIWRMTMKSGMNKKKIAIVSVLASIITLQLGAFSVTIETLISGITELPFTVFLSLMQPIHLAIGAVEGLITAAVLCFIYDARPELLYCYQEGGEAKFSYKKVLAILTACVVLIGGGVSLLASSNPDGLEWSIQNITGDTELESKDSTIYKATSDVQEKTSILPDYSLKNSDSSIGTSVSGIVGCAITVVVLTVVGKLVSNKKKKSTN